SNPSPRKEGQTETTTCRGWVSQADTHLAVIGTATLDVSVRNAIPLHSTVALVWEEYLVSLICAAGLGFAAWQKWGNSATKWTWVVPAAWFAFGFVVMAGRGPIFGRLLFASASDSVLYEANVR